MCSSFRGSACVCVWAGGIYSAGNDLKHKSPWLGLELQQSGSGRRPGRTEAEERTGLVCLLVTLAVCLRLAHELTVTFACRPAHLFFQTRKTSFLPDKRLFFFFFLMLWMILKAFVTKYINLLNFIWSLQDPSKFTSLENPIKMIVVAV